MKHFNFLFPKSQQKIHELLGEHNIRIICRVG